MVLRTLIPTLGGVLAGTAIGHGFGIGQEMWPGWDFMAGVALLCLLASALASALPAAIAITQDPVKVLRTP